MASRLADIGIQSLEDLLFHFPYRYQDRTRITPIAGLRDQLDAVVEGEVRAAAVTSGRRRSLLVKVEDSTGLLTLRFSFSSGTGIAIQARCRYSSIWDAPSGWGWYRHDSSGVSAGRWHEHGRGSADAHLPHSQWYGAKHVAQALQAGAINFREPPWICYTTSLKIVLPWLRQSLSCNPPPNADLSQIRDGNHRSYG